MKIIRFENPLPKEEIERFDKLFNKQHYCDCGAIFETDISDINLHLTLNKETLIQSCNIGAECPICHNTYQIGIYKFSDKDIENIEKYQKYLRNKRAYEYDLLSER